MEDSDHLAPQVVLNRRKVFPPQDETDERLGGLVLLCPCCCFLRAPPSVDHCPRGIDRHTPLLDTVHVLQGHLYANVTCDLKSTSWDRKRESLSPRASESENSNWMVGRWFYLNENKTRFLNHGQSTE